jgi:hypothetical protein
MALFGRITESSAATKTFGSLRIERRVLVTPARTITIANISTVSVGTHVAPKPKVLFWILALLFAGMAWASMRPDFTLGPLAPTGTTVVLGLLMLVFAGLALRPEDKTHYLLISSNDGVLSRFTAPDRAVLDEVRSILTEKINRGDETMMFSVNFEKGHIETLNGGSGGSSSPSHQVNGSGHATAFGDGAAGQQDRNAGPDSGGRPTVARSSRAQPGVAQAPNSGGGATAESFIDFSTVLPAIVEMHRFYARQPGTQHLEQRLSELELLMRAGTPTLSQKTRLREISHDMSQILQAYPQAVELFDHIGGLV